MLITINVLRIYLKMERKLREKCILRHFNVLIYAKGIMGKSIHDKICISLASNGTKF